MDPLSVEEIREIADQRLDKITREYYNGGCNDGDTLRENLSAFRQYRIRPRVLRNVKVLDTSVEVMGYRAPFPLGIAPAAMQCMAHPDGEEATSIAAQSLGGVPMGLSSFSTRSLEKVISHRTSEAPYGLQLYVFDDRKISESLVRRAKAAGYKAVFLTVDTPVLGRRLNEVRNKLDLPPHMHFENFLPEDGVKAYGGSRMATDAGEPPVSRNDASLNWEKDIPWLKSIAGPEMQVWVKGVMTGEDVELAIQHGVDGIIVSNHGGRQLDSEISTLDALPECAAAARGRVPIHMDSGIRTGADIFKAIALGADFVWIGRPTLWGLAYNGAAGVELVLETLYNEFKLAMALAGTLTVKDITKDYLVRRTADGRIARL